MILDTEGYALVRIAAELLRKHRFEGIAYRGSSGPGHCIVLFDPDVVEIVKRSLVQIRKTSLKYHVVAKPRLRTVLPGRCPDTG